MDQNLRLFKELANIILPKTTSKTYHGDFLDVTFEKNSIITAGVNSAITILLPGNAVVITILLTNMLLKTRPLVDNVTITFTKDIAIFHTGDVIRMKGVFGERLKGGKIDCRDLNVSSTSNTDYAVTFNNVDDVLSMQCALVYEKKEEKENNNNTNTNKEQNKRKRFKKEPM